MPKAKHERVCATCGRRFSWRKRWGREGPEDRYCGDGCRMGRPGPRDQELEVAILALLAERGGKTICPSDAAKSVGGDDWQELMELTRRAASRLVAAERVVITQRGRIVDPVEATGPIRIAPPPVHRSGRSPSR